ncbi:MAG: hypothetical protein IT457_18215 [Planctomycetes bacterium]|nr:hypothetical protein [Planctomycetota bacterium]
MEPRRFAIAFLLVEAALGGVWWCSIALHADWRARFFPPQLPGPVLLALAVADVLLYVAAAALAAIGIARNRAWARTALTVHAGGALYAGLFALALAVLDPERWLGGLAMLPSTCVAPWLAWRSGRERFLA